MSAFRPTMAQRSLPPMRLRASFSVSQSLLCPGTEGHLILCMHFAVLGQLPSLHSTAAGEAFSSHHTTHCPCCQLPRKIRIRRPPFLACRGPYWPSGRFRKSTGRGHPRVMSHFHTLTLASCFRSGPECSLIRTRSLFLALNRATAVKLCPAAR